MRLGLSVAGALLPLGLKWTVEFLPSWAQIVVGALVVAHLVAIFLRSTRRRSSDGGKSVRAVFVLWLAICVAATVLVAIGGFQQDDRALLGVVWPILALMWIGYRLRVGTATPQPGTDSGFRSR
jgi:ABC-type xylose transport system permease subunit